MSELSVLAAKPFMGRETYGSEELIWQFRLRTAGCRPAGHGMSTSSRFSGGVMRMDRRDRATRRRWWISSTTRTAVCTSRALSPGRRSAQCMRLAQHHTYVHMRTAIGTIISCLCQRTERDNAPTSRFWVVGALVRGVGSDDSAATADESAASAHAPPP